MNYKCDRCLIEHKLDESKVKNKQTYISPHGCFEGDYYIHAYFWFECSCGRAIKVNEEHLSQPYKIEKEYSNHRGVCTNNKFSTS
jgi:hypothetical protein